MADILKVYTLGQLGINRVKSPVHVEDGELLNAQNASIRPVQGQQAITKRDGMAKINSSVAAGSLIHIDNIPIDDPDSVELLYTARFGEADVVATNGYSTSTFSALTTPDLDLHNQFSLCQGHDRKLYLVKAGAVLNVWDGTTLSTVSGTPTGDQIHSMWFDDENQRLYCGFVSGTVPKVAYYDGASWTTLATAGLDADYTGHVCVLDDGTVFTYDASTTNPNGGMILRYNGSAWVTDAETITTFGFAVTSNHVMQQLYTDGDNVYALFRNRTAGGTPQKFIFKRDSSGTWSNISPTTLARDYGTVTAAQVWDNDLWVGYHNEAGTLIEIWKRTGTTWTIDFDILADTPGSLWTLTSRLVLWHDNLWATPDSFVEDYLLYRPFGGSWTHYAMTDAGYAMAPGPGL